MKALKTEPQNDKGVAKISTVFESLPVARFKDSSILRVIIKGSGYHGT
jgi:hypothetical protein